MSVPTPEKQLWVGEGNLSWASIVKAARDVGIELFIIEQDTSRMEALESAAISCTALRGALK